MTGDGSFHLSLRWAKIGKCDKTKLVESCQKDVFKCVTSLQSHTPSLGRRVAQCLSSGATGYRCSVVVLRAKLIKMLVMSDAPCLSENCLADAVPHL